MFVVAKHAEEKLREALGETPPAKSPIRCFHLKFSELEEPKHLIFGNFLKYFQEIPESYQARIYFCRDKDIFILMQGLLLKQFDAFIETLAEAMALPDLHPLTHAYELDKHWETLRNIVEAKLESWKRRRVANAKAAKERTYIQTVSSAFTQLDENLMKTVGERRQHRDQPLVMIADDDQISRTIVRNMLGKDYQKASAVDGREALSAFVRAAPDVLFLDIGLPDISGHQVLELLFQIDPDAYVIMFSGRRDKNNILRALEAGAQGFVGKPFTRSKLKEYIDRSPFIQAKLQQADRVVH